MLNADERALGEEGKYPLAVWISLVSFREWWQQKKTELELVKK